MLSLKELQEVLELNTILQRLETNKSEGPSTKRLFELQLHRTLIKDCIIQLLESDSLAA